MPKKQKLKKSKNGKNRGGNIPELKDTTVLSVHSLLSEISPVSPFAFVQSLMGIVGADLQQLTVATPSTPQFNDWAEIQTTKPLTETEFGSVIRHAINLFYQTPIAGSMSWKNKGVHHTLGRSTNEAEKLAKLLS